MLCLPEYCPISECKIVEPAFKSWLFYCKKIKIDQHCIELKHGLLDSILQMLQNDNLHILISYCQYDMVYQKPIYCLKCYRPLAPITFYNRQ